MNTLEKILLVLNSALYLILAIFTYCYVDLNLTLSQNEFALETVAKLQKLGYYNRPFATAIFLGLITALIILFAIILFLYFKKRLSAKFLTLSVIINTALLVFAYPFLSSDIFNYLFDAKIITHYNLSPYSYRPLDFPQDEWLRFMRWVHRYSPYGPIWLFFSTVPSFLGFGKFIVTLFLFKIFISAFHLINTYIIYKILRKTNNEKALLGAAFYALNPMFLIEGVVNAHNDVVLATFFILPIYFLVFQKKLLMLFTLLIGIFIKYIPILLFPSLAIASFTKYLSYKKTVLASIIIMVIFTFIFSTFGIKTPFVSAGATQIQFQPWYLFWTLPLIALITYTPLLFLSALISFGALLRYLPFLFYGEWSQPNTIEFMVAVTMIPVILSLLFLITKTKDLIRN